MNKIVSAAKKNQINQLRVSWEIKAKEYARSEIETAIRFHENGSKEKLSDAEKRRTRIAAEIGAMQAIKAMMPDVMKVMLGD